MAMGRFSDWLSELASGQNCLYIGAEMAKAHEGDLETALDIVRATAHTGADAIKFQCFTAEELLVPDHPMFNTFRELEMPWDDWETLVTSTKAQGLDV